MTRLAAFASVVVALSLFTSFDSPAQTPRLADAAGRYAIGGKSRINFVVAQVGGGGISGRFQKFSGIFRLAEGDIGRSSVEFRLYPETVVAGEKRIEDFLRSNAVFDSATFPVITFKSTRIWQTGKDTAEVEGNLTAKGRTLKERFQVRLTDWNRRTVAFRVRGDVYRSRYKMDAGIPIYSNVVRFDMTINGQRQ